MDGEGIRVEAPSMRIYTYLHICSRVSPNMLRACRDAAGQGPSLLASSVSEVILSWMPLAQCVCSFECK